ncbi:MAG: translation initiation factor IF-2 [Solirubrobacteraceae bacterium]
MPKKRVHEIAKERGMSSKVLLAKLQEAGLDVKAAASAVDEQAVLRVLNDGGGNGAPQASAPAPEETPRPTAEPDGNPPQPQQQGGGNQPQRQRPTRSGLQGERAPGAGSGRRRVIIDSQASRRQQGGPAPAPNRPPRRRGGRRRRGTYQEPAPRVAPTDPSKVLLSIPSGSTVKDVAEHLGVPVPEVIKKLMTLGEMATLTKTLSDDAIHVLADEFNKTVEVTHAADEVVEEPTFDDAEEDLVERPPVVTIMGHVDHGKTTLLDAIRESAVVETEAGGITQHIGAYQVKHDGRLVTFLDTPGHEAFTALRARGAKVTDIAVLVVAADDGVMPQTIESINHARAAEVPIVVAVNKIDRPDSNPTRVRQELVAHELQPEEWGGTTQYADVSAKENQGLDDLVERILLVADAELELTANPKAEASGPIIESRLDVGRGPVATMLVARGTLRVGDAIVAGDAWGKVRALYNYRGEKVKDAPPGTPVEILGFDKPPAAGEHGHVVENDRQARHLAGLRAQRVRAEQLARSAKKGVSLEDLFTRMGEGGVQELNLIIKADVQGSVEAVVGELGKIKHPEVAVNVIHTGIGAITESDIMLASASNAIVAGFNVRPNAEARALAEREGVDLRTYRVIYQLTEDIQQALVGMLAPEHVEESLGEAEVRALFRASRLGVIAGCYVTRGVIRRNSQIRVVREGAVIYETTIGSLKRFKDDVREVQEGFECGILLENFNDVKEGDVLEAYETREVERTDLEVSGNVGAPAEPEEPDES